jgi:hypothetical protein
MLLKVLSLILGLLHVRDKKNSRPKVSKAYCISPE